ncbi:MAG: alpha/beta fold hydrolase [Gammaproteobacteria bacterium]|nr:alpha/beta fold hydrolase [Gammaproteobacteria bacterium]MYK28055.1 alpha/beta fold hydrolase [Gammaproteobacteria bacterium]
MGEDVKGWCWRIALQASSGADASLGALAQLDQRSAMADLSCPALVAIGGQDGVVVPEIGRYAAGCLPNAELVEFEDCGHAVFLEDAERYHGALLEFLAGAAS